MEEKSTRQKTLRIALVAMAAVSLAIGIFSLLMVEKGRKVTANAAAARATGPGAGGSTVFATRNWTHLEKGEDPPPHDDTPLSAEGSRWAAFQAFKGLRAMAVYEAGPSVKGETGVVPPAAEETPGAEGVEAADGAAGTVEAAGAGGAFEGTVETTGPAPPEPVKPAKAERGPAAGAGR